MVGDMLTRKLLRDVRGAWGQFVAAAAVVFCASALFVSFQVVYKSLVVSRDAYYERYNFADFFVELEKAPASALYDVESVPGVWRARGRIVEDVALEVEGNESAVVGRFISMPDVRDNVINDVHIVTGGYFPGASATEVLVNERFCEANGLQVGDTFQATINERKEMLRIVGTVYSPEYVYAIRTVQEFAPNDRDFAVVFARESFVEDAFDMTNAFNNVAGLLRPGANVDRVLDAIKEKLSPYGVFFKYARKDQISNRYLSEELKGVRNSAKIVPMLFLIVAAVVIHIIVHRITEQQRTQIGLLCALGYSRPRIVLHYVFYALIIGVVGTAAGAVAGYYLAGRWVQLYNAFFRFPSLRVVVEPLSVLFTALLSCGMCVVGAARSAWHVLKVQPAVAIRPAPPVSGRIVHAGRLQFVLLRLGLVWRIALRNTLRARSRALFSIFGVAVSMVMLVVGATTIHFFDWIVDYQYEKVDRSDIRVDFAMERPEAALLEIASVEGVQHVEGILQFGAELRNGWRKKLVIVQGLEADSRLYRLFDTDGNRVHLPRDGLLVPERIARWLHLARGAEAMIDPYLRDKDERPVVVRGTVDQYLGVDLFADRRYLARLLRSGPTVNTAIVKIE
ncbi:MAG: ABC transporter permease, partial [Candidatus Brocadiae bacterium]|nr:ABC transporter permease [Candidatus Brocadiia bacterium]